MDAHVANASRSPIEEIDFLMSGLKQFSNVSRGLVDPLFLFVESAGNCFTSITVPIIQKLANKDYPNLR